MCYPGNPENPPHLPGLTCPLLLGASRLLCFWLLHRWESHGVEPRRSRRGRQVATSGLNLWSPRCLWDPRQSAGAELGPRPHRVSVLNLCPGPPCRPMEGSNVTVSLVSWLAGPDLCPRPAQWGTSEQTLPANGQAPVIGGMCQRPPRHCHGAQALQLVIPWPWVVPGCLKCHWRDLTVKVKLLPLRVFTP